MCTGGVWLSGLKGPSMRQRDNSLARYSVTTEGCSRADPILAEADRKHVPCLKPIRTPNFNPVHIGQMPCPNVGIALVPTPPLPAGWRPTVEPEP